MKTNAYLIKYAKAQIGKPYWFGTYGQKSSAALYKAKKKQYPKYYTASDFSKQYGKKVHDCAGLIKGALWCDTPESLPKYNAKQDYGATGFYNAAKKKGKISTFDKVNGRLVFKGNDKTKSHVGVYEDGYVIEAKGHAYGVVKTKFNAKSWPYWAQCHLFSDAAVTVKPEPKPEPESKEDVDVNMPTIKNGSKGKAVKIWQVIVGTTVDGEFGPKTLNATRTFQKNHGLEVDGIVGPDSWKKGLESVG